MLPFKVALLSLSSLNLSRLLLLHLLHANHGRFLHRLLLPLDWIHPRSPNLREYYQCTLYCLLLPIQTTSHPDVQGKVLSWNNMFSQTSLIVCPLVLSVIYSMNRDAIYYFSMIFSVVGALLMCYVSTWPNGKMLGKQGNVEKKELPVVEQKVEETRCQEACVNSEQEKDEREAIDSSTVDMSSHVVSAVGNSLDSAHEAKKDVA